MQKKNYLLFTLSLLVGLTWLNTIYAAPQLDDANYYLKKGIKLYKKNKYARASKALEKSLPIFKSTLGNNHTEVARVSALLGLIYFHTGDYNKASNHFHKVIKIFKIRKINHKNLLTSYHMLGLINLKKNQRSKAISYFRQGLSIARRLDASEINEAYVLKLQSLLREISGRKGLVL